jgi:hypothetical protein
MANRGHNKALQMWQDLLRNEMQRSNEDLSQLWNTNKSVMFFSSMRVSPPVLDRPAIRAVADPEVKLAGWRSPIKHLALLDPARQHRTARDHRDRDERTHWDRSEQAASRAGAVDGRAVEERRDPSEMGREGG